MPRFLRQFGLRSLLIFCTLAAGCFGLWRWHMTWVHEQHEVAAQLAEAGGTIRWTTWGPEWIHHAFGSFYFSNITVVDFHRKRMHDEQLQLVRQIPTVEELYIPGSSVTDDGMAVLKELPRIRKLALWRTKLTNETLKHVGQLPNLEVLDIHRTRMDEEGLVHLREHPRLNILRHDQPMTDIGVGHLASIPNLSLERLVAEGLSYQGVRQLRDRIRVKFLHLHRPKYAEWATLLADHPTITSLDVKDAAMTDQEFRDLVAPNRLSWLGLTRVPISDEAIGNVPFATKLNYLHLNSTQVTPTKLLLTFGVFTRIASIQSRHIRLSGLRNGQVVEWWGPLSSEELTSLRYARNLVHLTLTRQVLPSEPLDFSWLAQMDKLEVLRINQVGKNQLLSEVATLKRLKHLELDLALDLDPAAFQQIAGLPNLTTLHLRASEITDQHLEAIGQMKQLEQLNLSGSSVTDQGMNQLVGLDKLTLLYISACPRLTDEALRPIGKLSGLQYLIAQNNHFTDQGLRHLHGMPRLYEVHLRGTKRTTEGIQALRNSLPLKGGNIF